MKQVLSTIIRQSITKAITTGEFPIPPSQVPDIIIEIPKDKSFGDYACNVAMQLARPTRLSPRRIAEIIVTHSAEHPYMAKCEIAGPGFINFTIADAAYHDKLREVFVQQEQYGASNVGKKHKVMVEFVSANPTGPLHIGHGRGAAVGDTLARLLAFAGYDVTREYYINDAGNQMNNLGRSTYIRYMQLLGHESFQLDENCYQGDYIIGIARDVVAKYGPKFEHDDAALPFFTKLTGDIILQGIIDDLKTFEVTFDTYFSEKSLHEGGHVARVLDQLLETKGAYEEDGALWVKTTNYTDDKDRVVRRSNGETTYFAADIAYHKNKLDREFTTIIDIWGADHHGYVGRMNAAMQLLGAPENTLEVILIQLVNLLRDGKPVAMSTRSGEFDALIDVLNEVGTDAARYFFLMRRSDSQLDFDLELAKKQTNENPVFYVQYSHARCCSIVEQLKANQQYPALPLENISLAAVTSPQERELIKTLVKFPEVVAGAALAREGHRIPHYLNELASNFHSFYNTCRVIGAETDELTAARTTLVEATRQVVANGLHLLGVSAPQKM
ncbi:arginine--tRNA ligase [Chrysiogenes arsenatis]|uniref:arginine--tRNA ligase n=1 Tax=Chrysiogenes arsenatis TaxID=309797 RepID=UPI0003FDF1E2|nr:arginine--tRNA ligase [Chrysiogenes arsenatis]